MKCVLNINMNASSEIILPHAHYQQKTKIFIDMFHETFGHLGEGQEKESGRPLIRRLSIFLGLFKDNYDHSSKIYLVMNIMQIVYKNR